MYWVTYNADRSWRMLYDGTPKEYREHCQRVTCLHVDARMAHKLVRDDFPHSTALYIDEGRIRRATGGE
jgi:hypothetical protein